MYLEGGCMEATHWQGCLKVSGGWCQVYPQNWGL